MKMIENGVDCYLMMQLMEDLKKKVAWKTLRLGKYDGQDCDRRIESGIKICTWISTINKPMDDSKLWHLRKG